MRSPLKPCVLAIDPGSAKCGLAVVQRDGVVCFQAVVPTETVVSHAQELAIAHRPDAVVIGNGTGSKPLLLQLQAAGLPAPLLPVDESHTSQAARVRYLASNPPRGWQRLLPVGLRTPPVPYDDYVALILAERYWRTQTTTSPEPDSS
ncbi:MAG: hypothetical protein JWL77_697 [Chthonomonadaceae bacterium]|nr:hypothetical protein [Chthonomonadaceae bacterium]